MEWRRGTRTTQRPRSVSLNYPLYAIPVSVPEGANRTPPTIGNPSQDPDPEAVEPDQTVTVSVEVTDEGTRVSEVVLSYSTDEGQTQQ